MNKSKIFILNLLLIFIPGISLAQEIVIEPLFEYPAAPDDIESLDAKCDYLMKNFWNGFNFKEKTAINQYALDDAFQVYTTSMRFANKKEVDQSVDKLINKISGNPGLLIQFCKAAEDNLYGPKASIWIDEIYLKFIDALVKNKKVSQNRKSKYVRQASQLRQSAVGNIAPMFEFENINGETGKYFPMSTPTLLIMGNPDDTDWRLNRLKMDSNYSLQDALEKGKINIIYVVPETIGFDIKNLDNYNSYWTIAKTADIEEKYDLRNNPAIFLVGSDGKIMGKNLLVADAVSQILELVR